MPVQEMLSKIKWDKKFGEGDFEIGYWDRVTKSIIKISYSDIGLSNQNNFTFRIIDHMGKIRSIPLHRIKMIWKNKELIWSREINEDFKNGKEKNK
jgi:uncharacterized protein (UPF0248 family)